MSENNILALEPHIPQLLTFKESLSLLNSWWDAASIIARINQDILGQNGVTLLESMQATKEQFTELQGRLHQCLLNESFNKVNMDLTFKSQNVIDVLTRNLFERTADVGFLATDNVIRQFMTGKSHLGRQTIEARLAEYVAKYSVYEEIVLLTPSGKVTANFDSTSNITESSDPLIQEISMSSEPYLEYFRHSDMQPHAKKSHMFCAKICETDDIGAPLLGILVLFFKIDDEMSRIFSTLIQGGDPSTLALIDQSHKTLVSSNTAVVKENENVGDFQQALKNKSAILHLSNTKGYQGYMGLNWLGGILQPTKYAFAESTQNKQKADEHYQLWIDSSLVSQDLKLINRDANKLDRELRILALNGKSISHRLKAQSFMPILDKLQELGEQMGQAVSDAVTKINQTAFANFKANCTFYSNLAVELMDRNLYERANDCRWWALTPYFIETLRKANITEDEKAELTKQLAYINELYTVYTNLFIYDRHGKIIAASNSDELPTYETDVMHYDWFKSCKSLTNTQQYTVSEFEKSPYYGDKETYIYNAAISDSGRFVGGIGIVFDSTPEFSAMLTDSLPLDESGNVIENAHALFVDHSGIIISASNDEWAVGEKVVLPSEIVNLESGESGQSILTINDETYIAGFTASSGYREYKTTGDYVNDIIGLVMIRL